jgi:hypothetical protein
MKILYLASYTNHGDEQKIQLKVAKQEIELKIAV